MSELLSIGFLLCFVKWRQSYLSDCRLKARIYNSYTVVLNCSCPFHLRREVPQGRVPEPVIFSLFNNDLPAPLPSFVKVSLYADNLTAWASSPNVKRATAAIQTALNELVE